MKNKKLNQWLWKWHFIAGMISLPFMILLAITGAIYLFNPNVEKEKINIVQFTEKGNKTISYQEQYDIVKKEMKKKPNNMVLTNDLNLSTEFVFGKFGQKQSVFINPYSGQISGKFKAKDTWMFKIRKLHGELLGGKIGTKFIELIASWMLVLILTGLYIWFPFSKGIKGVFLIRFKEGKRTLFRDLHAVIGFWISLLLLITLAGGLPWTDVFGAEFKWIQKVTKTGYPNTWKGIGLTSNSNTTKTINLDDFVKTANDLNLEGKVTIGFPKKEKGTLSISNETPKLSKQQMLRYNQYSGKLLKHHYWDDVGFLMRGRMWLMAFHQGQFGAWNLWLMFGVAIFLLIMSIAAIFSYLGRKKKGSLGIPKVPKSFKVDKVVVIIIILLAIILPLFGISLLIIALYNWLNNKQVVTSK